MLTASGLSGRFSEPYRWFGGPVGSELLRREWRVVRPVLPRLHGEELLWLGIAAPPARKESHHRQVVGILAEAAEPPLPVPVACLFDPLALPFCRGQFDVVVLHHLLDCSRDPHSSLREAAASVRDGGTLVVVGFNPWSTWGALRLLSQRRSLPWSATFLSPLRLLDWLSLLGFALDRSVYDFFRPPWAPLLGNVRRDEFATVKNALGVPLGGVYVFFARKSGTGANMIRTEWRSVRPRPALLAGEALRCGGS